MSTASELSISTAAMRVVRLLVGNAPQTVNDLVDRLSVTRTAVTEQLTELLGAGFVEKTIERLPGRGRPRHLYRATDAALVLLFASNQHVVVPALWKILDEIGGAALTNQVIERLSAAMADHYRARITAEDPEQRLVQFSEVLADEGQVVEVTEAEGRLVLRKRSCAFISMFECTGKVCQVDERLLHQIIGAPVRQTACRHQGDPCCAFEIVPSSDD